jgi:hypothetical protein
LKGICQPYKIQMHSDRSVAMGLLPAEEANERKTMAVRKEAASRVQKCWARRKIRLAITSGDTELARELMSSWFSKPHRDNDEGYLDINLALNSLEAAYIQLTGNADMKGKFFPRMRERLNRGEPGGRGTWDGSHADTRACERASAT